MFTGVITISAFPSGLSCIQQPPITQQYLLSLPLILPLLDTHIFDTSKQGMTSHQPQKAFSNAQHSCPPQKAFSNAQHSCPCNAKLILFL